MSAAAHIDPRIRRRRIEVMRANGRRRLRRVLILLGIVGVVIFAIIVVRSPLFDLDEVAVSGAARTSPDDVLAVSGLQQGEPLMDADIVAAESAIRRLPWVFTVDVARQWPGTVAIEIVERQGAAALPSANGFAVVDRFGHVLERVATPPDSIPVVAMSAGAALPGEIVEDSIDAVRVASAMPHDLEAWVVEVTHDGDAGVELQLVDDGVATFGTSEALHDKYVALATVLTRVDLTCVDVIDVRVAQTPVLTRRPGCS